MSSYQFANAWDNVAGLADISPQPSTNGIQYGEYEASSLGIAVPQGRAFIILEFDILIPDDFAALNTFFGVSRTTRSNAGTFRLRDDSGAWINQNGYILYPNNPAQMKRTLAFWKPVQYPVIGLRNTA